MISLGFTPRAGITAFVALHVIPCQWAGLSWLASKMKTDVEEEDQWLPENFKSHDSIF